MRAAADSAQSIFPPAARRDLVSWVLSSDPAKGESYHIRINSLEAGLKQGSRTGDARFVLTIGVGQFRVTTHWEPSTEPHSHPQRPARSANVPLVREHQ